MNIAVKLIENLIKKTPRDKCLFIGPYGKINVTSFESRVHQSAEFLKNKCAPGDRVLFCMNDSIEMAVLFYSTLLVGAIPVVINPRSRAELLKYHIEDSEASILLVDMHEEKRIDVDLSEGNIEIFHAAPGGLYKDNNELFYWHDIDKESYKDYGLNEVYISVERRLDEVCLWQYTSGTTGLPKAVMHTGKGILSMCEIFAEKNLKISSSDILYSIPKSFFGYGMGNTLFFPVFCGATSIITEQWPVIDDIHTNITTFKPTVIFGTPAIYQKMIEDDRTYSWIDDVRILFSAGSVLSSSLYKSWIEKYKFPIVDGIGATELLHVFISNDLKEPVVGSTGRLLEGFDTILLNREGDVCEIDEVGTLLVRGPTLSRGYWNKPSKQKEKFNNGYYKTGDLFCLGKNGCYYYKGREDDLFKVKGRWVDPHSIEQKILNRYNNIRELMLIGIPKEHDLSCEMFLVSDSDKESWRDFSKQLDSEFLSCLDSHSRPKMIHFISQLPRNNNGKIIRKKPVDTLLSINLELEFMHKRLSERNINIKAQSLIRGVGVSIPERKASTGNYPRFDNTLVLPSLVEVTEKAIKQSNINAMDIDLIVSYSMSIDHLAYQKEIYGPRICHPLQKEIGANNAFAFDLTDASTSTVLDVTNSILREMNLNIALIVRVDVNSSLVQDSESGFSWTDGAAALILQKNEEVVKNSTEYEIETDISPCILKVTNDFDQQDAKRGEFSFSPNAEFKSAYKNIENKLYDELGEDIDSDKGIYSEKWFVDEGENTEHVTGPYGFFLAVAEEQKSNTSQTTGGIIFDPYRLTLSAHSFKLCE
jgi:benzoate-CoA ligase